MSHQEAQGELFPENQGEDMDPGELALWERLGLWMLGDLEDPHIPEMFHVEQS